MEIDWIIPNFRHLEYRGGQEQVSETFQNLQKRQILTKLWLNNYILKSKYAKIGKGLLLFVEDGAAVDGDYYLKCWRNMFM